MHTTLFLCAAYGFVEYEDRRDAEVILLCVNMYFTIYCMPVFFVFLCFNL